MKYLGIVLKTFLSLSTVVINMENHFLMHKSYQHLPYFSIFFICCFIFIFWRNNRVFLKIKKYKKLLTLKKKFIFFCFLLNILVSFEDVFMTVNILCSLTVVSNMENHFLMYTSCLHLPYFSVFIC